MLRLLISLDVIGYFFCSCLWILPSVLFIKAKSDPSRLLLLYSINVRSTNTHWSNLGGYRKYSFVESGLYVLAIPTIVYH